MVADEDLREREQPDRNRERRKDVPALGEVASERRSHQTRTGCEVEDGQGSAEHHRCDQRAPEDVFGFLAASLTRCGSREQNGENRRGKEERDAREGRSGCVGTRVVSGEACLDDEDVDVREQCDRDEADSDRSQVAEERTQIRPG